MRPSCWVYAPRTFRRTIHRYEEDGLDGLIDKRLAQVSHRRAPVDEVMRRVDRCRNRPQDAGQVQRPGPGLNRRPIGCRVRSAARPIAGLPAQSGSSNCTKSGQVYLLLTPLVAKPRSCDRWLRFLGSTPGSRPLGRGAGIRSPRSSQAPMSVIRSSQM